jgi:hypothetical protein
LLRAFTLGSAWLPQIKFLLQTMLTDGHRSELEVLHLSELFELRREMFWAVFAETFGAFSPNLHHIHSRLTAQLAVEMLLREPLEV